jgi:hypothetical protein
MISLPAILEEKCAILLREKISFAGLINKSGRLVASGLKVGLTPIVDEFEREKLFMEYVLMASMRKDFDYCLGRVKYTASKGEKNDYDELSNRLIFVFSRSRSENRH